MSAVKVIAIVLFAGIDTERAGLLFGGCYLVAMVFFILACLTLAFTRYGRVRQGDDASEAP